MTSLLTFRLLDAEGKEGSTSVNLPDGTSLGEVDAFVSSYYSALVPLTNAAVPEARWRYIPPLSPVFRSDPTSNVYNRLIVLCTNGEKRASITIPSPAQFATVLLPTYSGFKLAKTPAGGLAELEALTLVLANSVLYDGTPFPSLLSEAAYMVTQ